MSLSAFLAQNAKKIEPTEFVVSDRFMEDGEPVPWVIKPITGKQNKELIKECTKLIPINGKRGQYRQQLDNSVYNTKLCVLCTQFPNLNDAELQNSYGVMGAEALLDTMLLPGEMTGYLEKVLEVCGFDTDIGEKVDTAKN